MYDVRVLVRARVCECSFPMFFGTNHVNSNGLVLNIRRIQSLLCHLLSLTLSLLISLVAQLTSYFYFRIFPIQIWFGISIWNHILAKNPAFPVHFEQYLTPVHRFISHSPPPPPLQPPSSSSSSPSPSTYSLRILCKHHKMHIAKPKFIYLQMQVFVSSCVCDVGIFAVLKASSFVCSIREQHSHICICISVHIHNIACSMCTFECTVLLFFACNVHRTTHHKYCVREIRNAQNICVCEWHFILFWGANVKLAGMLNIYDTSTNTQFSDDSMILDNIDFRYMGCTQAPLNMPALNTISSKLANCHFKYVCCFFFLFSLTNVLVGSPGLDRGRRVP